MIELILGDSVTTIGEYTFQGCSSLTSITSLNTTASTITKSTFDATTKQNATLYVSEGCKEIYQQQPYWQEFLLIIDNTETETYTLTYIVDGEVYTTYDVEYGGIISPEPEPTKEGYTFSGWSEMPASDVTVTGTFTFIGG